MPDFVNTMFSVCEQPWHGKGVIVDHALTAAEAIQAAGLDWEIQLHPVSVGGIELPNYFASVRRDTGAVLGIVGSNYEPFQNRDLFSFFDPVVDREAGAFYHTGGVLLHGRRVWLLAKIPGDFCVTKEDWVENYVLLASSHDGSLAITAKHTPIRVVCWNTLGMALADGRTTISIKHTVNAGRELRVAHAVLGLATRRAEKVKEAAETLLGYRVTSTFLKRFLPRLLPSRPENEGRDTSRQMVRARERIEILYAGADTNNLPGMEGTGWALYNAVAEYVDHDMPARQNTDRLDRAWFGSGEALKLRAFRLLIHQIGGEDI